MVSSATVQEIDNGGETYADAVAQGHYNLYVGGVQGKHDNVRCYWEDGVRGLRLRNHIQHLVQRARKQGRGVRICDLGAGTGEGLRLLTSLNVADLDLHLNQRKVITFDDIDCYIGTDLSEAMVRQGEINFQEYDQVHFVEADFNDGFALKNEEPFDLYFCSYGSFSHINGEAMRRLLRQILDHVRERAVVVGDWLGRYSIEWPCYWDENDDKMLDYSMSYIPGSVGGEEEPECFPMRFWTGAEIREMVAAEGHASGVRTRVLDLYDSSVFVGRHVDTNEYNNWVQPLRLMVNRLHEPGTRTDLEKLKATICPVPGHENICGFYAGLQFCWNSLVEYTERRLAKRIQPFGLKNWREFPSHLQLALVTMDRVIDAAYWMQMGDPRANIIEPQLGYALRQLEMDTQNGWGCGHSLVGVFEVNRR